PLPLDDDIRESVEELVQRAILLSADVGKEVEAAVRRARERPLADDDARRFFRRVVAMLDGNGGNEDPAEVAARIDRLVAELMDERDARIAAKELEGRHLRLQAHGGLPVRRV